MLRAHLLRQCTHTYSLPTWICQCICPSSLQRFPGHQTARSTNAGCPPCTCEAGRHDLCATHAGRQAPVTTLLIALSHGTMVQSRAAAAARKGHCRCCCCRHRASGMRTHVVSHGRPSTASFLCESVEASMGVRSRPSRMELCLCSNMGGIMVQAAGQVCNSVCPPSPVCVPPTQGVAPCIEVRALFQSAPRLLPPAHGEAVQGQAGLCRHRDLCCVGLRACMGSCTAEQEHLQGILAAPA